MWRSGWDSNPRGVAPKLISSQPRYDRFDTAPYRPRDGIQYSATDRSLSRMPFRIYISFSRFNALQPIALSVRTAELRAQIRRRIIPAVCLPRSGTYLSCRDNPSVKRNRAPGGPETLRMDYSLSAHSFNSSTEASGAKRLPGNTSVCVISDTRAGASVPIPLPPEVANSTTFLPEKS